MTEPPSRDEALERLRLVAGAHPFTDAEAKQIRALLEVAPDLIAAARMARSLAWLGRFLAWTIAFFIASFQASEIYRAWVSR